ncbi:MAG: DNA polymerase III subunit delta [Chlamydiae bacterium]|nr:MAG: DNA polymerase III subunit delta [Chlamydiota bacterium]
MATKKTASIGITPASFAAKVKGKSTGPACVIIEENKLDVENLFILVKKELISPGTEDFCLEIMHADSDSVTGGTIVSAAETMSMMGGFRVIWVKYADELAAADLDIIANFIEKAIDQKLDDVLLVLVFGYFDKRTKFSKFAVRSDIVVECKADSIKDIPAYVKKQYDKKITKGAVELIKRLAGNDALATKNELDKACLYVGDAESVTENDVAFICLDTAARNEWSLSNYILNGDSAAVFNLLSELEKAGLDEMYRHAIITTAAINLQEARQAQRSGTLYRNFYKFREPQLIERHLRSVTEKQMSDLFSWLMYSEIGAKGGNLPVKLLGDIACIKAAGKGSDSATSKEYNKINSLF